MTLLLAASVVPLTAAASVKAAPTTLAFTYQEGAAALPAAQTLAVSATSGNSAVLTYVVFGGSQWLTFTPLSGRTNFSIKVTVNPTSLPIGQYTETLTLMTPDTGGDPVLIPVTLTVKAPPPDLRVTPSVLNVSYRLGDAAPSPVSVYLTTTGGLLSFAATATGAKWLRLAPVSGAVFAGFRTTITATIDVTDLTPGAQKGSIAISAPDAVTKTTTVAVNLTIQPGVPVAATLWPPRIIRGAPDSTFTITGSRFFSGTLVKSGATALKTTVLGANSLLVTVPASLLATAGTVPLSVSNPDPGGGAAQTLNLDVLPPGPMILSVLNGASQRPATLAPAGIFTIYGAGLGPDPLVAFDGTAPYVPTTMSGTRVLLNGVALPVIYSSATQVSAAAPNTLDPGGPNLLEVEYNSVKSVPYPLLSASVAPAIFTAAGSGTGNAAAFQADATTGDITLNADKTPATKGSILILYATGVGPGQPAPPDGFVATAPSTVSIPNVSVLLGDVGAEVLYAGAAPGLITGITQINARVPDATPIGKAVPVTLIVEGVSSQPGVTLNIK